MKSWVAGVLAVAAFAANVADADMIYTGGVLSSLGSETTITGAGSFEVHGSQYEWVQIPPPPIPPIYTQVARGEAEVVLTADSLSLTGGADGYGLPWTPLWEGSVSGRIEFDVTESRRLWLDWDFIGDDHEAWFSIVDEDGQSVIGCTGAIGCGGGWGSPTELWVFLDAGRYRLNFSSHSEWGTSSIPVENQFALTLSPVPLPAAAWLLLSGLGGLGLLRRRRVL